MACRIAAHTVMETYHNCTEAFGCRKAGINMPITYAKATATVRNAYFFEGGRFKDLIERDAHIGLLYELNVTV